MTDETLELNPTMPPPGEVEVDDDKSGKPRLWLALVVKSDGKLDLIERNRLEDFREAMNDPDIIQVQRIYRGIRKEFNLKTQVQRKIEFL